MRKLKREFGFRKFILWGRSMGAITAIMYMSNSMPLEVEGLVLDSPLANLGKLVVQLVQKKVAVPGILI